MEGWVGLVGWPIADALPTKWSHVNHGSGVDQGKSASYRPTFLPLSHAANQILVKPPREKKTWGIACVPRQFVWRYAYCDMIRQKSYTATKLSDRWKNDDGDHNHGSCISHGPSQWERAIFDPHKSETPRPICMKLEIYNQFPDTTPHAQFQGAMSTWVVWAYT